MRTTVSGKSPRLALVAPRNMRFSPNAATAIDLHIHEVCRASAYAPGMTVFAEKVNDPFTDVSVRFWPKGDIKQSLPRLLAREGPDLIVVHQHLPAADRIAKAFGDVPVVLVRHGFLHAPGNVLSAFHKRRQLRRLAGISFVSERCRAHFGEVWPDIDVPCYVTPNGVDTAVWSPSGRKEPLILFVGRLAPEKGVLEGAKACAECLPRHSGWRAVFVLDTRGAGPDYARAVQDVVDAADGRLEIVANVSHGQVRAWMRRAAIVIAPTQIEESFGRVAIEAMASEAALIAARSGGFVEIGGDAAILLETPAADQIARAMDALISDPGRRVHLATRGRERCVERYDISKTTLQFDAMVEDVLSRRESPRERKML